MESLFSKVMGAIESPIDVRDYKAVYSTSVELPDKFKVKYMPLVKNQQSVGSCVAHAVASLNEWFNHEECNDTTLMSTGFIYGNRRDTTHTGTGMIVRDALHNLCVYGNVHKSDFRHNVEVPKAIQLFEEQFDSLKEDALPHRIKSYARVYTTDDIKRALMSTGPVVFAIRMYKDTRLEGNTLVSDQLPNDEYGGHCMLIYGWDENGWLIRNSWGNQWGNSGNCILPYNYKIREAWVVVDDTNTNVKVKHPFSSKLGNFIANIINFLGRLFKKH